MSFRNLTERSKFEQEIIIDHIYKIIDTISKYDGGCYGKFVYNVIIPRIENREISSFNTVDLWFKTQTAADKFINQHKQFLSEIISGCYSLKIHNEIVAEFTITISEEFPRQFKEIDCLCVTSPSWGTKYRLYGIEDTDENLSKVLNNIAEKKIVYTQKLIDYFSNKEFDNAHQVDDGWKHYLPNGVEIHIGADDKWYRTHYPQSKSNNIKDDILKKLTELQDLIGRL